MTAKKTTKYQSYFFIILTIIGCVLACSSIITNDYLKLILVMATLCFGLFGIMKALSNSGKDSDETTPQDHN